MGDRGNIAILTGTGQVWFYTHWRGSELTSIVKQALSRKERWDDSPYLARILWDSCVPSDRHGGDTGFGIDSRIGDNEHPIVCVDVPKQRVFTILEEQLSKGKIPESFEPSESKSFTEFIA
jgi:hypothetical protein